MREKKHATRELSGYGALSTLLAVDPPHAGTITEADGRGFASTPDRQECVELSLQVDGSDQRIEEARFRALGPPALVACADRTAGAVVGLSLEEAKNFSVDDLQRRLDRIPRVRRYCMSICVQALRTALSDHLIRRHPRAQNPEAHRRAEHTRPPRRWRHQPATQIATIQPV